jgi:hypothetical protein
MTKHERLLAIVDAYQEEHGRQPFTTESVAEWAITLGLYPLPGRGDDAAARARWAERYIGVVRKQWERRRAQQAREKRT